MVYDEIDKSDADDDDDDDDDDDNWMSVDTNSSG